MKTVKRQFWIPGMASGLLFLGLWGYGDYIPEAWRKPLIPVWLAIFCVDLIWIWLSRRGGRDPYAPYRVPLDKGDGPPQP